VGLDLDRLASTGDADVRVRDHFCRALSRSNLPNAEVQQEAVKRENCGDNNLFGWRSRELA